VLNLHTESAGCSQSGAAIPVKIARQTGGDTGSTIHGEVIYLIAILKIYSGVCVTISFNMFPCGSLSRVAHFF
jgi:hypothetical protein